MPDPSLDPAAAPDAAAPDAPGRPLPPLASVQAFIDRWQGSGGSEEGAAQLFVTQLCTDVLGVEPPDPPQPTVAANAYVFERRVTFDDGGTTSYGKADVYKRGCFVLEAKQGADAPGADANARRALGLAAPARRYGTATRGTPAWSRAMSAARAQAARYAAALGADERALGQPHAAPPPFLVAADVGHCLDLYADFARQGSYTPFPDPTRFRIPLAALADDAVRERLRLVWTDPRALDPARRSAAATRALAQRLAVLAEQLEAAGHASDAVAPFLMRCLFTMFAEDIGLLPERAFTDLLTQCRGRLRVFPKAVESLWRAMDTGGYEARLMASVKRFNGYLFKDAAALPVTAPQLDLLVEAAEADWADVEPAIFGTLLERALDPRERHRLGAHYTPRAYVERLVTPTLLDPLRQRWHAAQAAAAQLDDAGKPDDAAAHIQAFHRHLCGITVLDPACGTGNFLYVTLDHLKRLEGEVLATLHQYAGVQAALDMTGGLRVSPAQLTGLEVSPRAAAIAEVVLWIGYLQWHFRTHGSADRLDEPLLRAARCIRCQDAVLAYDEKVPQTDGEGRLRTRWDRRSFTTHPATGERVPDETAQEPVFDYTHPRPADWPEADFIVGNPPFIGKGEAMREALGDGYTEALRAAYYRRVPKSADFVMFWWYKAAKAVRKGLDGWAQPATRFGFVSTNSVTQTFNRRVVEKQMKASPPVSLAFAIPDHPWVSGADGADVRVAMTAAEAAEGDEPQPGTLQTVTHEARTSGPEWDVTLATREGNILADLTIGPDVLGAEALDANADLVSRGVQLIGQGFSVEPEKARDLGLGEIDGLEKHIRPYLNGRDMMGHSRDVMVIDLFGLEAKEVRDRFTAVYQHVKETVKPDRDQNRRKSYRENWWIHGEPRTTLREALDGLDRYIATSETAKHRVFRFLEAEILPDNKLVVIALDDAYHLGVLSSRIHVVWALAAGGRLGVGNDPVYVKTQCFDPFPFPSADAGQRARIREVAERLDAHRAERLAQHDGLTMTALYNVLAKLRAEEPEAPLSEAERTIHTQGLVGVLKELHDELDAAVAAAYGWEAGLGDEAILRRLVRLGRARRAEEAQGRVRYLRPAYQAPGEQQTAMDLGATAVEARGDGAPAAALAWPAELPARAHAVHAVVHAADEPLGVEAVARRFHRARRTDVAQLLETLAGLGLVREVTGARYAG